jgi:hypothetical protein
MSARLPFLIYLLAGTALLGQTLNDLNSLVLQADRFATYTMDAKGERTDLKLSKINGTSGGPPGTLMHRAMDVQDWTFLYRVTHPDQTAPSHGGAPQRSVTVHFAQGQFLELEWLQAPVMDCKSLEWRWMALSLDQAIGVLNRQGFQSGFSHLTLMRPLYGYHSDEFTYVFNCPQEQAVVGVSAVTGQVLWTDRYNP